MINTAYSYHELVALSYFPVTVFSYMTFTFHLISNRYFVYRNLLRFTCEEKVYKRSPTVRLSLPVPEYFSYIYLSCVFTWTYEVHSGYTRLYVLCESQIYMKLLTLPIPSVVRVHSPFLPTTVRRPGLWPRPRGFTLPVYHSKITINSFPESCIGPYSLYLPVTFIY